MRFFTSSVPGVNSLSSLSTPSAADIQQLPQGLYRPAWNACLLGLGVFALCLFGILSRPGGDLASFWPANAFMLGMLVRYPHFAHKGSWLAAAAGYLLADALTGSPLVKNLLLNAGNLASVAAGYLVFWQIDPAMRRLRTPLSVLYMLLAVVCAAFTAGLFGLYANPYLFHDKPLQGFAMWFATEMATDIAFLPAMLSLPEWQRERRQWLRQQLQPAKLLPALALLLSVALGSIVGGPGAIAFPVPALMWCAVSYSLFTTSILTFGVSAWSLVSIAMTLQGATSGNVDRDLLLSVRMGLSLVMLTPIMIGSVMAANRALVQRLRTLADQDELTGLPNRRAFLEAAHTHIASLHQQQAPCAVLMLDIDHFKSVNDRYGHATGDVVLTHFGRLLRECLREHDVLGRMGGEEFAALLPRATEAEALATAERVRQRLAVTPIPLDSQLPPLHCTVSVGVTVQAPAPACFDTLLGHADQALYLAKAQGRNRVVLWHRPS